jgi:threonyl-tRNA synthetase
VDDRTESLNRKIREAQLAKTPLILTCGAKEQAAGTVSVRTLDGAVRYGIPMARFLEQTTVHVADRRLKLDLFDE